MEEKITSFVQENPMIYKKSNENYKNKYSKQRKWEELAKSTGYECKNHGIGITYQII